MPKCLEIDTLLFTVVQEVWSLEIFLRRIDARYNILTHMDIKSRETPSSIFLMFCIQNQQFSSLKKIELIPDFFTLLLAFHSVPSAPITGWAEEGKGWKLYKILLPLVS